MSVSDPQSGGEYQWGAPRQPGAPGYGYPPPPQNPPGYGFPPPQDPPGYGYPQSAPGYGFPQQAGGPAPVAGAPLLSLGDITVVGDQIITPAGNLPLRGAVWNATDMSRTEEKIPAHAVVLAVVFFVFCLLGLFFLLMKERQTTGFIQVSVTSGGRHHSTMLPATHPNAFQAVMAQINYARSLSSM